MNMEPAERETRVRRTKVAAKVRGQNPRLATELVTDRDGRRIYVCYDRDAVSQCRHCKTPVHRGCTPVERWVSVWLGGGGVHVCEEPTGDGGSDASAGH